MDAVFERLSESMKTKKKKKRNKINNRDKYE